MTLRSISILLAALLAVPTAFVLPAATAEGERVENVTIPGFDGTPLAATLFVPSGADESSPVPFVLMTHGWAGTRTATLTGRVAALVDAGYGVLTWDSRGFGQSGGEVMLNDPNFEGRDVSALIDWLVDNAPVAMEGDDPVIGMNGVSYAGGIQLLAAAFDDRIDVITPEITWNNLLESLAPNGVPKAQWVTLLFGAGLATSCSAGHKVSSNPSGCQTSALARYYATVLATNGPTDEVRDALLRRSPSTYMAQIDIPTLVVQGFPDTLFDVDQGVANYLGVKANGAPAKLWLYDGGHAGPGTQSALIREVVIAWLDCHLALESDCSRVGPEIEYYQAGEWRTGSSWPPAGTGGSATVSGIPPLSVAPVPTGSSGQWVITLANGPADATELMLAGADVSVTFDATTTVPDGAFLHAALGVRTGTSVARVDGQTQPVRIQNGTDYRTYTIDLVDVAATVKTGQALVLTLTTSDPAYNNARGAGFVYLKNVATSFATSMADAPVVVNPCGADAVDLPDAGLALDLRMSEAAYDALDGVSGAVVGTVTVEQDGARVAGAFVTVAIARGTWAGNVGRETLVTGVTNDQGALCFAAPLAWSLPGTYTVGAEVGIDGAYASGTTTYRVG